MLRNIPNKYTQASLLQEIDHLGFEGTYNFFYLPMDVHNRTNVGYAFINFVLLSDMAGFIEAFTDYKFRQHQSQKIARVSPAHVQGFLQNVCHFSNCAVTRSRNTQYRPIVVYHGQHRDLTEVLSELQALHHRQYPSAGCDRAIGPDVLAMLESAVNSSESPSPSLPSEVASTCSSLDPAAQEFVPSPYIAAAAAQAAPVSMKQMEPYDRCLVLPAPVPSALAPSDLPATTPVVLLPRAVATPCRNARPPRVEPKCLAVGGGPSAENAEPVPCFSQSSFSLDKTELEQAVSNWLKERRTLDNSSTEEGDACSRSSSASPRSDKCRIAAGER